MPPKSKAKLRQESVGGLALGCCVDPANYVWMVVALFVFTLFLAALCCTSCIATRWIYKRRMKRKCEGLREKYRKEAEQRRETALAARRIAMRPPTTALRVEPSKEVLAKFVQLGRLQQQNADLRTAKEPSVAQLVQTIPTQQNVLKTSNESIKADVPNKTEEVNVSLRKSREAKSINMTTVPPDTVVVEPTQSPSDKPSLPLDPTPPSKSSSPSEFSGYTVPTTTTTTTTTDTSSSVSMETQKDTPTQSTDTSNAKPTESTATPTTATEATPTTSEAPPTNARFPYFSGPTVAHRPPRNKRSAWVENTPIRKDESNPRNAVERKMSSTSVSSFVTAGSGQPPNAYDLRRMVLQGKGLRTDRTQPTSSASRESGYNHLRTLSKKDPADCLKSISLNGLPATREKK